MAVIITDRRDNEILLYVNDLRKFAGGVGSDQLIRNRYAQTQVKRGRNARVRHFDCSAILLCNFLVRQLETPDASIEIHVFRGVFGRTERILKF